MSDDMKRPNSCGFGSFEGWRWRICGLAIAGTVVALFLSGPTSLRSRSLNVRASWPLCEKLSEAAETIGCKVHIHAP
jgi:hypothetical protein